MFDKQENEKMTGFGYLNTSAAELGEEGEFEHDRYERIYYQLKSRFDFVRDIENEYHYKPLHLQDYSEFLDNQGNVLPDVKDAYLLEQIERWMSYKKMVESYGDPRSFNMPSDFYEDNPNLKRYKYKDLSGVEHGGDINNYRDAFRVRFEVQSLRHAFATNVMNAYETAIKKRFGKLQLISTLMFLPLILVLILQPIVLKERFSMHLLLTPEKHSAFYAKHFGGYTPNANPNNESDLNNYNKLMNKGGY